LEDEIWIKNQSAICVRVRGISLRDSAGEVSGALIVLNDVTRVHRLEDMRKEFVANVSHELKTPITLIKGFVETLSEGGVETSAERAEFLSIINAHANRLNAIIEDLLTLSKIEQSAGIGQLQVENHSVNATVKNAIQLCSPKAEQKRVRLEFFADKEWTVAINRPLLEQALINLIDNAIKYSEAGKAVTVSLGQEGSELRLCVKDEGPGIAQEHLPHIFQRFYRVDKARSRDLGGTGLGLAIVKHIVLAHSGRVAVESEVNKGSAFSVFLPI
jgi:two-component system phosphate regulon sensor histidine kinase PhoR